MEFLHDACPQSFSLEQKCVELVDSYATFLFAKDYQDQTRGVLQTECNKIEGHVQQCKRLVLQYIPLILVNGEKFLEKNDVCVLVQACPASQKRTVISFLEGLLLSDA
ncbi:hypothetical protein EJB05_31440 [Eragrostis curvula]|uniref:Saposin B-type domain-containing protein n=1 Tax=Eragrostis curvula TaxID=38414 RepID=A0A5J9UF76_9POAL|nr:hypothetical protein EJB05_31440 [Eragrostis curvula]